MQRSRWQRAFVLAVGLSVLGACKSSTLFHSTDDKAITTDIQAKLFSDPILKARDVHVDSRNGIVTLTGDVNTSLEKSAVERIAMQADGVKNVVNLLSLPADSATPPAGPIQTSVNTPPPKVAPAAAAPIPEKPHPAHHAKPAGNEVEASPALEAYTNSVAPDASPNPPPVASPSPAPAATTGATAQTPAVQPSATIPPAPSAAPPPAAVPPPPVPKAQNQLTVPAGTVVTVRMVDGIDSSRNRPGEEFAATLDAPIVVGDRVVASRGADARVRLAEAKSAGKMTGQSQLKLELIAVTINGVPYSTKSGFYEQHGASRGTRTAETVGGGAVLGALIGGLLGRGKGAAIGSAVGAGTGAAVQVSTQGEQVKVPAETKLDFTLQDSVTVTMGGNS